MKNKGTKAKKARNGNPFGASDNQSKSPEMMLNSKSFKYFMSMRIKIYKSLKISSLIKMASGSFKI